MALKQRLTLWSSTIGDVLFGSAQAAAIGASFGNGSMQFGQDSTNSLAMGDDGNLNVQISSAGISPSATAADKILAVVTIPVTAFDEAFRGISIFAAGNCPNTNAKTLKVILNPTNAAPILANGTVTVSGGTTIASLTATGAGTQGGWQLQANLFKYGAPGSNTQLTVHEAGQVGSTVATLVGPQLTTANEAATVTIVITGNSTTGAGDIVFNFLQIFAMN